jgi:hypothetical protein
VDRRAEQLTVALSRHRRPWTAEPAMVTGWYVLDADGRLVTWCALEGDALDLVAAAAALEVEGAQTAGR